MMTKSTSVQILHPKTTLRSCTNHSTVMGRAEIHLHSTCMVQIKPRLQDVLLQSSPTGSKDICFIKQTLKQEKYQEKREGQRGSGNKKENKQTHTHNHSSAPACWVCVSSKLTDLLNYAGISHGISPELLLSFILTWSFISG